MTKERLQLSIQTVKDNITILESLEPEDAGYYLQLEHEKFVLSALEKQMPKKPIILRYQPLINSGWKHGCPNCGCAVGVNKNIGFAYNEYLEPNESYCCSCGQALDWSDTE